LRSVGYVDLVLNRLPGALLRIEGAAVAGAAVALYFHAGYPWWLLVALALAPDLSAVGFAAGASAGTAAYNSMHTSALPVILGAAGVLGHAHVAVELALIWLIHIGVDRAIGYGLKYPTGFKDTHLQRV
jgi:hypothetical protein